MEETTENYIPIMSASGAVLGLIPHYKRFSGAPVKSIIAGGLIGGYAGDYVNKALNKVDAIPGGNDAVSVVKEAGFMSKAVVGFDCIPEIHRANKEASFRREQFKEDICKIKSAGLSGLANAFKSLSPRAASTLGGAIAGSAIGYGTSGDNNKLNGTLTGAGLGAFGGRLFNKQIPRGFSEIKSFGRQPAPTAKELSSYAPKGTFRGVDSTPFSGKTYDA